VGVAIVGTLVVPCLPDLFCNRPSEHVQDLVPLISRVEQPSGHFPHLRRRVIPQLGRHYPVHDQMEARVHWTVWAVNLSDAGPYGLLELWVLVADHNSPHVLVGEVLEAQL